MGVDIFVLTQDPKDIDSRLRNLVNKHLHIAKNKLGMRTLLEWKYCANNPIVQAKDAFAKVHKIDDNVKNLYKSAEIHTVNTTKVSKWVYAIPVLLVAFPALFYLSYVLLKNGGRLKPEKQETPIVQAASQPALSSLDVQNALQSEQQKSLKASDFVPHQGNHNGNILNGTFFRHFSAILCFVIQSNTFVFDFFENSHSHVLQIKVKNGSSNGINDCCP